MGRNILSICDYCKVYVFHLRGKESDYMQAFQNYHSEHEKDTRIVSDYVTEQPEHYLDITECYEAKNKDGEQMRLETPEGLIDYIDHLLELTIMSHERSPQGYTDPMEKQYLLGKRHALQQIRQVLAPKPQQGEK